jgi:PTS system sucrose-specific IIC component
MLGIGEPLIFGITLPLGRPFLTACLGGEMGDAFQAEFHASSIVIGVSGLRSSSRSNPAAPNSISSAC